MPPPRTDLTNDEIILYGETLRQDIRDNLEADRGEGDCIRLEAGRTALLDNSGKFWKEGAKEIPRIVQTLVE